MSQSWLITGSSGFVGRALLARLATFNQRPPLLRLLERRPTEPPTVFQSCAGDLGDPQSLRRACEGIDTVIHLAGIAHVGSAASAEARAINLDGSLSLLRMAIDAGVRRFVFLSSTLSSDQSIQYGRDKHAVEEALLAAAAAGSIEVVILRAVNIYGVGMRGNIAAMIRLISSGVLPRLPKLTNRLSLVGVDDVVSALLLAATLDSPADPSALMAKLAIRVTLTDGCTYEINAIEKSIYDAVERSPSHWRLPVVLLFAASAMAELLEKLRIFRSGIGLRTYRNLTRDNLFDNHSAKAELGFEPSTTFFAQIDKLVRRSE
ncbi:MAG: NAD-dependent epimerase/dehydratase family protein [Gammaproteobacteria bacterium]|nr:NAD-dependent epimerase/dehydratase family protein [Gammaproteobacteria bacterium]MDG1178983.1 NAD-dependent epimerase/dehydratase family protein [Gammaproteobacteria bacterium]MDG1514810.1 NAD-dependent epimerase/dehydratase family protein [Gammaproteobacteria bacterium]MDG1796774.1 NAD-dependent epimerase/dehydratase family protein [Gammaproteobacteria bacterium]MDG2162669.1 NAD-dependent epimerase/dehydratase family protein [Gammaproteobacteria bacterium]